MKNVNVVSVLGVSEKVSVKSSGNRISVKGNLASGLYQFLLNTTDGSTFSATLLVD
jgi:uncharacterized protein YodC (DUF2158 family)